MTLTERRKRQLFADFDRFGFAPAANFSALPISRSAGKLLKGATVAYVFWALGSLLPQWVVSNIVFQALICFASLRIAQAWFFREADVLERRRWKRFWHGGALVSAMVLSWIMAVVLFGDMPPPLRQRLSLVSHTWSPWIVMYVGVYLAGLLGGFYNVKRWDKRDKDEILDCFQEWRLRQSSQTA